MTIRVAKTIEISRVRQERGVHTAVEGLTVIIEPKVHGASDRTRSIVIGVVGDGEESRLPDHSRQNIEHGGGLTRHEGISQGKETSKMEEEKVTITLREAKTNRGTD